MLKIMAEGTPCHVEYIVQGHRFDIFEDVGCYPATIDTPPAIVIIDGSSLILSITSATYGGEFLP